MGAFDPCRLRSGEDSACRVARSPTPPRRGPLARARARRGARDHEGRPGAQAQHLLREVQRTGPRGGTCAGHPPHRRATRLLHERDTRRRRGGGVRQRRGHAPEEHVLPSEDPHGAGLPRFVAGVVGAVTFERFGPVLPRGAFDLLPEAAAVRARLRRTLLDVFERFGYQRVEPARLEYRDVAERGLPDSLRDRTVRFIEPDSGEVAILPADVTPQVARMVGMRLGGDLPEGGVFRYAYAADLVRRPRRPGDRAEFHQVGLELLGDADPAADAEVLEACAAALSDAGLADFVVDLSHSAIPRALLDAADRFDMGRDELRRPIARKDAAGLSACMAAGGAPEALVTAAARMCRAFGPPAEALAALREVRVPELSEAISAFETVVEATRRLAPQVYARLRVDPLEIRGFDYYTGMRFRVWAKGVRVPVAGGGRYDDLVGRFGPECAAVGGAVDLEALHGALPASVQGRDDGMRRILVGVPLGADRGEAVDRARRLRDEGACAFVVPAEDEAAARALAGRLGADRVVWCAPANAMRNADSTHSSSPGASS
ncbi:MAG: hypothetical protein D6705_09085 [Deltaproteobacteria bacterium]|nr:MAG: hypothetical protein D6705_09085 [Deltaproteobacteria bacterium]